MARWRLLSSSLRCCFSQAGVSYSLRRSCSSWCSLFVGFSLLSSACLLLPESKPSRRQTPDDHRECLEALKTALRDAAVATLEGRLVANARNPKLQIQESETRNSSLLREVFNQDLGPMLESEFRFRKWPRPYLLRDKLLHHFSNRNYIGMAVVLLVTADRAPLSPTPNLKALHPKVLNQQTLYPKP